LTGGEVSDSTQFETSLDIGPDIRPRIAVSDKGYDSEANRAAALARGVTPVIPRRENSKQRGRFFPKRLYKLRARIEQTIGKLKRFKRVAMRCEKTDNSYSAIISFACGLMLVNPSTRPNNIAAVHGWRCQRSSDQYAWTTFASNRSVSMEYMRPSGEVTVFAPFKMLYFCKNTPLMFNESLSFLLARNCRNCCVAGR